MVRKTPPPPPPKKTSNSQLEAAKRIAERAAKRREEIRSEAGLTSGGSVGKIAVGTQGLTVGKSPENIILETQKQLKKAAIEKAATASARFGVENIDLSKVPIEADTNRILRGQLYQKDIAGTIVKQLKQEVKPAVIESKVAENIRTKIASKPIQQTITKIPEIKILPEVITKPQLKKEVTAGIRTQLETKQIQQTVSKGTLGPTLFIKPDITKVEREIGKGITDIGSIIISPVTTAVEAGKLLSDIRPLVQTAIFGKDQKKAFAKRQVKYQVSEFFEKPKTQTGILVGASFASPVIGLVVGAIGGTQELSTFIEKPTIRSGSRLATFAALPYISKSISEITPSITKFGKNILIKTKAIEKPIGIEFSTIKGKSTRVLVTPEVIPLAGPTSIYPIFPVLKRTSQIPIKVSKPLSQVISDIVLKTPKEKTVMGFFGETVKPISIEEIGVRKAAERLAKEQSLVTKEQLIGPQLLVEKIFKTKPTKGEIIKTQISRAGKVLLLSPLITTGVIGIPKAGGKAKPISKAELRKKTYQKSYDPRIFRDIQSKEVGIKIRIPELKKTGIKERVIRKSLFGDVTITDIGISAFGKREALTTKRGISFIQKAPSSKKLPIETQRVSEKIKGSREISRFLQGGESKIKGILIAKQVPKITKITFEKRQSIQPPKLAITKIPSNLILKQKKEISPKIKKQTIKIKSEEQRKNVGGFRKGMRQKLFSSLSQKQRNFIIIEPPEQVPNISLPQKFGITSVTKSNIEVPRLVRNEFQYSQPLSAGAVKIQPSILSSQVSKIKLESYKDVISTIRTKSIPMVNIGQSEQVRTNLLIQTDISQLQENISDLSKEIAINQKATTSPIITTEFQPKTIETIFTPAKDIKTLDEFKPTKRNIATSELIRTVPKEITETFLPEFDLKKRKLLKEYKQNKEIGYVPRIRKKQGQDFVDIDKPLPYNKAYNKAGKIVDKYANRSFYLQRTNKLVNASKEKINTKLASKFRQSYINPNIFVEKSKYAIDSIQEKKQIPYKSARIRRSQIKGVKWFK